MGETILWHRLDLPGHEIGRLNARDDGWELSGVALFLHEGQACQLEYRVHCDSNWHTRGAWLQGILGEHAVDLTVAVDAARRWSLNGEDCSAVAGCLDIDLGFSPSTNLLPIRRLELAVGQEAAIRAAWLPFPALRFQELSQTYRRESESTYRYESGGGRFVRLLDVDATGFVRRYPGIWEAETS